MIFRCGFNIIMSFRIRKLFLDVIYYNSSAEYVYFILARGLEFVIIYICLYITGSMYPHDIDLN